MYYTKFHKFIKFTVFTLSNSEEDYWQKMPFSMAAMRRSIKIGKEDPKVNTYLEKLFSKITAISHSLREEQQEKYALEAKVSWPLFL